MKRLLLPKPDSADSARLSNADVVRRFLDFIVGYRVFYFFGLAVFFILFCCSASLAGAEEEANVEPHPSETAESWVAEGDRLMQKARDSQSHDFTKAGEAYQKALELDADDGDALLGMAWVANSNHDFKAGREWCEKVLAVDPRSKNAYNLMGDGAVELGAYDEAFDYYQSALDLQADLSTFSRAGHLLWLTGNTRAGEAMMRKAIEAGGPYPENAAWCHAELAMMLLNTGAIPSARQHVESAEKLSPENPRVLVAKGRLLASEGKTEEAIAAYEKSVELMPTHDALAPLAALYGIAGEEEKAAKQVEKVLAFHDTHSHGHEDHGHPHLHHHGEVGSHQLALFLADQNRDLEFALEQAKSCQDHFPNIRSEDALAWCYYRLGKIKEARRHMTRALAHNTPDPLLLFHAGVIELAAGSPGKGRKLLADALNLNPAFDPVHADEARKLLEESRTTGKE